jgi:dolichyl-diphosphooligosaccharide--protein glycosyltransferase
MRNIETVVRHFPHFNTFDPYQLFPGGGPGLLRPFFAWLVAATILLTRGAASTLHNMEVVAAYVPAILGTLTLIPVYFIGKELFNRWVGVISAALVIIIPSEFMHRSLLGFTDHHVVEVLFSTVCMLFLIMAVKRAREREISFTHILSRNWSTVRKPLIYTLLAGIFLGIYLLTWIGGLLFVFIIFAYLVIQFMVDHLRHKSTDYLCIIGTPVFLIALLMLLPLHGTAGLDTVSWVSLSIAIVIPVVLSIISRLMSGKAWKPVYYPLTLAGLMGIGLAVLHVINPSLLQSIFSKFSIFTPTGAALTIMEVSPLLFPNGSLSLQMAWLNFNASFFIAFVSMAMLVYPAVKEKSVDKILFAVWLIIMLIAVSSNLLFLLFIGLAMLIYFGIKEEGADKILLLVWSIIMLMAVLGQRRFAYYYTINAALLTGYFSWKMLDIAGLNKLLTKPKEVVESVKKFKKAKKKTREKPKPKTFMQPRGAWVRVIVVGIILFAVVFLPSIPSAKALAGSANFVMDEGWYTSLLWLKDNSPDPFGDPNFYYALYPPQDEFKYPDTAYGVMSWWDYGHFIMQIAHRIPNANPGQAGAVEAGKFFTALNESSANEWADTEGTKYVVIDYMMPTSKFYAMVDWAGSNESNFQEYYGVPPQVSGGNPQGLYLLYNSAYYRSTVARLYNFNGEAVAPSENSTVVIPWSGESVWRGIKYKNIIGDPKYFSSYADAQAYVAAQTSGNYGIVGYSPFATIVPLEKLNSYKLIYQSNATAPFQGLTLPSVKIFQYLGSNQS